MRMIFVNLPVKDLPATRRFFGALGFSFNEAFSDETAACMVVDENIFVMHLTEEKFAQFVTGAVGDAVGGRCTTAGPSVRDGGRWRQLAATGPGGAGQGDEPDLIADADGGRPCRHDGQGLCGGQ